MLPLEPPTPLSVLGVDIIEPPTAGTQGATKHPDRYIQATLHRTHRSGHTTLFDMASSQALCNLESLVQATDHGSFQNEYERRKAVQCARELLAKLETPWDTASRLLLIDPFAVAALKTLANLQVFSRWQPVNSAKTLAELTQLTGCDSRLLCKC